MYDYREIIYFIFNFLMKYISFHKFVNFNLVLCSKWYFTEKAISSLIFNEREQYIQRI